MTHPDDGRRGAPALRCAYTHREYLLAAWLMTVIPGAPAQAHERAENECVEAGEFIKNAALSRDAGLSEKDFMSQLELDLLMIQAFPPRLRWFVQDKEDETLLVNAVTEVFHAPAAPEQHRSKFLGQCLRQQARSHPLPQDLAPNAERVERPSL